MKNFLTNMYNSLFLRIILLVLGSILIFDYGILPLLNMANTLANILGVIFISLYLYLLYQIVEKQIN
jgi:hypothetical protein